MKYIIIEGDSTEKVEDEVERLLREGWSLQGGIGISVSESDEFRYVNFAQAMVKKR